MSKYGVYLTAKQLVWLDNLTRGKVNLRDDDQVAAAHAIREMAEYAVESEMEFAATPEEPTR